tara:strand:- start:3114 stop:3494 length:381 start_codon:yes stop_codon:yes gene_type:complete
MISEKIKKVEEILRECPDARDDDNDLIATYWRQELMVIKHEEVKNSVLTQREIDLFYFIVRNGMLSNPESIRRSRQKLQQVNPKLRGEKYNERHAAAKKVVKELKEVKKEPQGQGLNALFNGLFDI